MVLWQIAEEEGKVEGKDPAKPLNLTWRSDVPGSTPQWYQDLVACCIDGDPAKQPLDKVVLEVLELTE